MSDLLMEGEYLDDAMNVQSTSVSPSILTNEQESIMSGLNAFLSENKLSVNQVGHTQTKLKTPTSLSQMSLKKNKDHWRYDKKSGMFLHSNEKVQTV